MWDLMRFPRTKLLKLVIMIYKWYVKLKSLRDRGFIYHDMSLISFFISWYVTNFIFLYYDMSVISFDLLWFVTWTLSWYVAMLYHDILRWFIMIYYDDLSWYITMIYHDILRRYIMICQNDRWVSLSRSEKLSFFFFWLMRYCDIF